MTDLAPDAEDNLLKFALHQHKVIDGEYGCPGATCPGVQRLVTFGRQCIQATAGLTEARTGPPAQVTATGPYIAPDGTVPTFAGFAGLPEHSQPSNLPRVNRADEPEQEAPRSASTPQEEK